jgi:hypothetical protein
LTQAISRGRRGERRGKRRGKRRVREVADFFLAIRRCMLACLKVLPGPGFLLCPMTNMTPLRCADVTGCLLTKGLPKGKGCGQRTKIFSRPLGWYVIRWVFGFLGLLLALQWQKRWTVL